MLYQRSGQFLEKCNLPTLSQKDSNFLDMEFTCDEITKTMNTLKNSKSPGPDGICNEFYKKFSTILAPYLLKMYNMALEAGPFPPSLNEAVITLIPKKGKDLKQVRSYTLISLLNTDLKILTKSLIRRLDPNVAKLIYPDQTGFIPNRQLFHNFRRLLNIMYYTKLSKEEDLFILSLDAEKAFDCVEWPYLLAVLEKFGIGVRFISWIKLLYSNPNARILSNRNISDTFKLYRLKVKG